MDILYAIILGCLGVFSFVHAKKHFVSLQRKQRDRRRSYSMVFLKVTMPRGDSREDKERSTESLGGNVTAKEYIEIMQQLFESLHAIFKNNGDKGEDFFSVELAIQDKLLAFYIVIPRHIQTFFEKQVAAYYPDAFIDVLEQYPFFREDSAYAAKEFGFSKESYFPMKTFHRFSTDPMNGLINVMDKLEQEESAALQIVLRPIGNTWQEEGRDYAKAKSEGKEPAKKRTFWSYFHPKELWSFFTNPGGDGEKEDSFSRNTSVTEEQIKILEEKNTKTGFEFVLRVLSASPDQEKADSIVDLIVSVLRQYDDMNGNSFEEYDLPVNRVAQRFLYRSIESGALGALPIMTGEEAASLFHFPNIRFNKSTVLLWQEFKVAPPPSNLPKEGTMIGKNYYRGRFTDVRITRDDRRRHFYIIGKSGTGKSTLLEEKFKQDIRGGEGLCIIDPHGDLVEAALRFIPRERADDVIYFNPGDLERPMGLNILEAKTDDEKEFMASEALAIFIKMYGEEIMGPRLQNYFRNGALTLMSDDKDPATLIDILRLFADEEYLEYKKQHVRNAAVKAFWEQEYAKSGQREKQEIIPYFAAKFSPFISNTQIRNIIGQTKSGFNFRDVMDNKKILLVNLSKGKIGELNARLLGMLMVAKLQMAAMSRVDTPEDERADFYMYIDEFQNFVTDSFASILSEARKYRLCLIIAHQYISQITKMWGGGKGTHEDTTIRDAVFGNVGTMLSFKIGAQDAEVLAREFAPVFSETDFINIAARNAYVKLNINNTTSQGFSMQTFKTFDGEDEEAAKAYMQLSRLKYARDRKFVEQEIKRRLI